MTRRSPPALAAAALAVLGAACASAPRPAPGADGAGGEGRRPPTASDVAFVTGMIHHHAQAVVMSAWAPTHDASPEILTLAERIDVSQRDEIAAAQRWLAAHGQPVPQVDEAGRVSPSPAGADSSDAGGGAHAHHAMPMPGMLTPDQLARLDAARGPEFDRLFLTLMIPHHEGAITMVEELFRSPGAAQDEAVFRFASDVQADQAAEIDRMKGMLAALPAGPR